MTNEQEGPAPAAGLTPPPLTEYEERDAQIWGEVPPRDGIDQYAREVDPFYRGADDEG